LGFSQKTGLLAVQYAPGYSSFIFCKKRTRDDGAKRSLRNERNARFLLGSQEIRSIYLHPFEASWMMPPHSSSCVAYAATALNDWLSNERHSRPHSELVPKVRSNAHHPRSLILPRNLRDGAIRPSPHRQLPDLIHDQDTQSQREGYQPELPRNAGRPEQLLDTGLLGHEDGD
jgi:hypothetical protein